MGKRAMGERAQLITRNRLGASSSLYLRQHADQPVHWQPWDDVAFDLARAADKPILLSVGYAACHWCHVMARESFADPAIAAVMNDLFVSIKVDREERPDLDRFYLAAVAAMGKAAGWPLTAFLTLDAVPFGGGGYYPPEPRFGLPGFPGVLRSMAACYYSGRHRNLEFGHAGAPLPQHDASGSLSPALLDRIARTLAGGIDTLYGGFGTNGPKFLHAAGHEFLLRAWDRTGDPAYLRTVADSAAEICNGAVFDHAGGGFHRYAVDDRWRVPHFEKMLNDNALMVRLCTQLWQATAGTLFAARVDATIGWLLDEMRLPGGAFASSLSADSAGEDGKASEGAFYLWTEAELHAALGDRRHAFVAAFQIVTDEVLGSRYALTRRAGNPGWTDDGAGAAGLAALRAARVQRPPPLRDGKCLADWNGLAVTALTEAGMAFQRSDWITHAQAVFAAILDNSAQGALLAHSAADGTPSAAGLLDDYAAMTQAALTLYEATAEPAFLDHAVAWEHVLESRFWDEQDGAYFLTSSEAEQRIPRQKLIDETASPAGNGIMLGVLARLYACTGDEGYSSRFEGILRCFADRLSRAHLHGATALCHSQELEDLIQIVIVGEGGGADALRRAATSKFLPGRMMLAASALPPGHPAHGKPAVPGGAAAYVCIGPRCLPPAAEPGSLADRLSRSSRRVP